MANIDKLLIKEGITHRELSKKIGNSNNWFNDAFNNNEDIRLSSLIKVISVISKQEYLKLDSLFDYKILEISAMKTNLSYEDESYINQFIISERKTFVDVIGDWAAMNYRNKLNNDEQKTVEAIRQIINNN